MKKDKKNFIKVISLKEMEEKMANFYNGEYLPEHSCMIFKAPLAKNMFGKKNKNPNGLCLG